MKDRLVVIEGLGHYGYQLAWKLGDSGEIGLIVGEGKTPVHQGLGDPPMGQDDWEVWTATRTARGLADEVTPSGFIFHEERRAREALRACNAALKKAKRPLEDWEAKALAAGWKPPKNRR